MKTVLVELLKLAWEALKLFGCLVLCFAIASLIVPICILWAAVACGGRLLAHATRDGGRDEAASPDSPTVIREPNEARAAILAAMEAGIPIELRERGTGREMGYWCACGHRHETESGARFCVEMTRS